MRSLAIILVLLLALFSFINAYTSERTQELRGRSSVMSGAPLK